jgi:hypothetical protein
MNKKKILTVSGFGLAILGGYLWMINQFPLSLIIWGFTFLIIVRLNRLKKAKDTSKRKR